MLGCLLQGLALCGSYVWRLLCLKAEEGFLHTAVYGVVGCDAMSAIGPSCVIMMPRALTVLSCLRVVAVVSFGRSDVHMLCWRVFDLLTGGQ
jgi:hypothetical protein